MSGLLRTARLATGLTAAIAAVVAFGLAHVATAGPAAARTAAAAPANATADPAPAPVVSAAATPAVAPPARRAARPQRVSRSLHRTLLTTPHRPAGVTVAGTWVLPNTGPETSCFCMRWGTMHKGIDLAGKLGSPILAVGAGVVLKAGPASGFGNWVVIQHANGDVSIYGHMRYFFVHAGEHVTAGEKIALVGDQGFSTGPHLHFEVHRGGLAGPAINPVPWLRARGIKVGPLDRNG